MSYKKTLTNESKLTPPEGFSEYFYETTHARLHALVGGKGKVPVFLLAGWPQTSIAWRFVLPLLVNHFRIYAVDLRGQGQSQIVDGPYDTLSMATDIKEIIKQLGYEKVIIIGHDVGAWVAFTFAKYFQENVLALGLLDAAIPGLVNENFFSLENAKKVWQFYFHTNIDIAELLIKDREIQYFSWYFQNKSIIKDNLNQEVIAYYVSEYTKPGTMRAGLRWYQDAPLSSQKNKMKPGEIFSMPILTLGGESATGLLLYEGLKPYSKSLIGGIIPNCGHYLPEEQPVAVADWILKLSKNPAIAR